MFIVHSCCCFEVSTVKEIKYYTIVKPTDQPNCDFGILIAVEVCKETAKCFSKEV